MSPGKVASLRHTSMDLSGVLTLLYVGANILCILLCNRLFAGFVAAKPEGRKTAFADKFM